MDVETIRAIERIIIVIFAGTSIVLGWHLFKIGVVSPQSGDFSGKGFKFSLQKVGPGIFFSLFGAVILSLALINGLKTETIHLSETFNKKRGIKEVRNVYLANSQQESNIERLSVSINTLEQLIDIDSSAPYENHRKAISTSMERLKAFRDTLAFQQFGAKITKYQSCLTSLQPACKNELYFKEVNEWLTRSLLQ